MSNTVIYTSKDGVLCNAATGKPMHLDAKVFKEVAQTLCLLLFKPSEGSGIPKQLLVIGFDGNDFMKLGMFGVFRDSKEGLYLTNQWHDVLQSNTDLFKVGYFSAQSTTGSFLNILKALGNVAVNTNILDTDEAKRQFNSTYTEQPNYTPAGIPAAFGFKQALEEAADSVEDARAAAMAAHPSNTKAAQARAAAMAEHPAGKGAAQARAAAMDAHPAGKGAAHGATAGTAPASRGPVDPDRWYIELQSGDAVEDRELSSVASDPSLVSRMFLRDSGRVEGLEEVAKGVQAVFVHSESTLLDYVALHNGETERATVVPLDTFYSSNFSKLSISMSASDFDDLLRVFGGLTEDDNKQILSTMERSSTSVVNDEGNMTTTISVQSYEAVYDMDDDLFLTVLKDISNEEITLFDGMFHDYFKDEIRTKPRNIGRISLDLSEGKFDYPSVIGKFESAFKSLENNMYLFDPKVLGELLKELPKDTRVYVPVDPGTQLQGQGIVPGPYTASIVDRSLMLA